MADFRILLLFAFFIAGWLGQAARAQLPPPREPSSAPAEARPRLFVQERNRELGTLLDGEVVTVTWRLENHGTADLVIERTEAACGCTVVKLRDEDKTLRPATSLDLTVEFNSTSRLGEQNKGITLFSNDPLEPELKLTFHAVVEPLYTADPSGLINLRVVRRGETAERTLNLLPVAGRGDLVVEEVLVESGSPFEAVTAPWVQGDRKGQQIKFVVSDAAAVGPIQGTAIVKLSVDGLARERPFPVRGEIVADLTWLPKVLDATRLPSLPGTSLAPVKVSSTDRRPFEIREAWAGPLLAVAVEPGAGPKAGREYTVQLAIREDAPPGPFGTTLRIVTSALDQPIVDVPVFGIVLPRLEVEPPMIHLRGDGTPAGTQRRLRIKTADVSPLAIQAIESDSPAIEAVFDAQSSAKYSHLRYYDVRLTGALPSGTHQAVIRITTKVKGAERIEVPVRIEIPDRGS